MQRPVLIACGAVALAIAGGLTASCEDTVYGRGVMTWSSHPDYGWYDSYYGPFHDGYWGTDGLFWFRLNDRDRDYRPDRDRHFRHDNDRADPRFQRFDRSMTPPPRGTPMPRFPKEQSRERDRSRSRDRH